MTMTSTADDIRALELKFQEPAAPARELTPLEQWMEGHRTPGYRPWRVPRETHPLPRIAMSDRHLVRDYEYSFGFDRRRHTEPAATLEEFIARNSDPKYRPWKLPVPKAVKLTLTASQRKAEEAAVRSVVRR